MSEQEFSQEEIESREAQESSEVVESRDLEQTTTEPEAHVEATRDYQEAEEIEAVVVDLIDVVEEENTTESVEEAFSSVDESSSTISANQRVIQEVAESREDVGRDVSDEEKEAAVGTRGTESSQPTREAQISIEDADAEIEKEFASSEPEMPQSQRSEDDDWLVQGTVVGEENSADDPLVTPYDKEVSFDDGIEEAITNKAEEASTTYEAEEFNAEEEIGLETGLEINSGLEEEAITETEIQEIADLEEEGILDKSEIPEEALEGVEEYWEPPEMYVHHGQDGTTTIVGPDGKPLDSPPIIQKIVDGSGKEQVIAYYPGMDASSYFSIESYDKPVDTSSTYVHIDSAGKPVVVDSTGKPIDSPPMIQIVMGSAGSPIYKAQYPGTTQPQQIELQSYVGSFEKELFVHVASDGTKTVVDAAGKPIDSPPQITIVVDGKGQEVYKASYPGGGEESKAILSSYTAPLEGYFVHYGQDGTLTVVDAAGKSIDSPPPLTKILDGKGQEQIIAGYPGTGQEEKVVLQAYQPAQVDETFIGFDSSGKPMVVDASGKPIDSPPLITTVMGSGGTPVYKASYPGHETQTQTTLSTYSAPLDDCYIHVGQDGKTTVVDADGKPLDSQPTTHKILDPSGKEIITAWYQDGTGLEQKYQLSFYKPPSPA